LSNFVIGELKIAGGIFNFYNYSISELLDQQSSFPSTQIGSLMRYELRCRECHKSWGNVPKSVCEECFSPLEVFYDYDAVRHDFTREKIAQGPNNIWRYSALLPLPENHEPTLPVGFTPLIKASGL